MALLLEFEKTKKVVMDALCSTPVWAPLNQGGNTGVNYMHARSHVIPTFYHSTQTHAKPRDLTRTHGITISPRAKSPREIARTFPPGYMYITVYCSSELLKRRKKLDDTLYGYMVHLVESSHSMFLFLFLFF